MVVLRLLADSTLIADVVSYAGRRGKESKTSDMGMYGTSKLYLLMMSSGLQQRLRVSHAEQLLAWTFVCFATLLDKGIDVGVTCAQIHLHSSATRLPVVASA